MKHSLLSVYFIGISFQSCLLSSCGSTGIFIYVDFEFLSESLPLITELDRNIDFIIPVYRSTTVVVVSQCFLTSCCIYVVNYSCVGRKATFLVTSHRLQIAVYQFQVSLNLISHPVARSTFVEFEQFFLQSCCIGSLRSSVEITVFVCIPASVSISTCYIYRATVNNSISYFSFFLIHCDSHRFNDVGIISLDNFSMSSRMSRSCITIAKVCNQLDRNLSLIHI